MVKKNAKKKKDETEGLGLITPEDQIKHLQSEKLSLEVQLAYRTETSAHSSENAKETSEKCKQMKQKYENSKEDMKILTKDMTRQYVGMKDELLHKITTREAEIQNLQDELESTRTYYEQEMSNKNQIMKEKEMENFCMKEKMEQLSSDFANMISDALKKMQDKIVVHSSYEDQIVPIKNKMEKFNFKSNTNNP